jgi:hypothetical protein
LDLDSVLPLDGRRAERFDDDLAAGQPLPITARPGRRRQ